MTRLIVEDGGKRRAFKVGDGTLTIGSGGGASLRLSDPAAAEVHAELLLREGRATLRLKPGVLPPRVAAVSTQTARWRRRGRRCDRGGGNDSNNDQTDRK